MLLWLARSSQRVSRCRACASAGLPGLLASVRCGQALCDWPTHTPLDAHADAPHSARAQAREFQPRCVGRPRGGRCGEQRRRGGGVQRCRRAGGPAGERRSVFSAQVACSSLNGLCLRRPSNSVRTGAAVWPGCTRRAAALRGGRGRVWDVRAARRRRAHRRGRGHRLRLDSLRAAPPAADVRRPLGVSAALTRRTLPGRAAPVLWLRRAEPVTAAAAGTRRRGRPRA
jgi:hypothetical protein